MGSSSVQRPNRGKYLPSCARQVKLRIQISQAGGASHFRSSHVGRVARLVSAVMRALDFFQFGTIVDVGGGEGALLADILSAHPKLRGVLFDQPTVIARADTFLERGGVRSRCDLIGGSFFDSVPGGGDAYILKFILHDWDDATSIDILSACRRAMSAEAMLLVLERMIGPPNDGARAPAARSRRCRATAGAGSRRADAR